MATLPASPATLPRESASCPEGTATTTTSASVASPPSRPTAVTAWPARSQRRASPPPTLPLPSTKMFTLPPRLWPYRAAGTGSLSEKPYEAGQRDRWCRPPGPARWDAEIVEDLPNQRIAWKSIGDSQVDNAGAVRFDDRGGPPTSRCRWGTTRPGARLGSWSPSCSRAPTSRSSGRSRTSAWWWSAAASAPPEQRPRRGPRLAVGGHCAPGTAAQNKPSSSALPLIGRYAAGRRPGCGSWMTWAPRAGCPCQDSPLRGIRLRPRSGAADEGGLAPLLQQPVLVGHGRSRDPNPSGFQLGGEGDAEEQRDPGQIGP